MSKPNQTHERGVAGRQQPGQGHARSTIPDAEIYTTPGVIADPQQRISTAGIMAPKKAGFGRGTAAAAANSASASSDAASGSVGAASLPNGYMYQYGPPPSSSKIPRRHSAGGWTPAANSDGSNGSFRSNRHQQQSPHHGSAASSFGSKGKGSANGLRKNIHSISNLNYINFRKKICLKKSYIDVIDQKQLCRSSIS